MCGSEPGRRDKCRDASSWQQCEFLLLRLTLPSASLVHGCDQVSTEEVFWTRPWNTWPYPPRRSLTALTEWV